MYNKYQITEGGKYCDPCVCMSGSAPVEFNFRLSYGWDRLLNYEDGSTHKIAGISDLLGSNSVRLGVRNAYNKVKGAHMWRPVLYTHKNGHISYPYIPNMWIRADGSVYNVKIEKTVDGFWRMDIIDTKYEYSRVSAITGSQIKILLLPRLQGPYIELGNDPSPVTTITEIEWVAI